MESNEGVLETSKASDIPSTDVFPSIMEKAKSFRNSEDVQNNRNLADINPKKAEKRKERRQKKKEKRALSKAANHVHESKGQGKAIR